MQCKHLLVLAALALLSGCANHFPQETVSAREINRELTSHQLTIHLEQGEVLDENLVNVKATESKTFKVYDLTNYKVFDAYTPYQPAREIYELPLGIAATAGGIVINVVDFALLGLIPNKMTDGALDVGFAGMNPFLNIESEARKELELISTKKEFLDEKVEHTELPLADRPLTVASDGQTAVFDLDDKGEVRISLLHLFATLPMARELSFAVELKEIREEEQAKLSRRLRTAIYQAQQIAKRYEATTPEALADLSAVTEDILTLSELGFEDASLELEDRVMAMLPEEGRQQLLANMNGALAQPAPPSPETPETTEATSAEVDLAVPTVVDPVEAPGAEEAPAEEKTQAEISEESGAERG